MTLFAAYSYLAEAAHQHHHPSEEFVVTRRYSSLIELLIVDEANRLKDAGLEQIRDIADRGEIGLILLGQPGLDKRLQRAPQLYSRIGFAQEIAPLSEEETRFFLAQRWSHRISAHSEDFTDQEAIAAILRITQGNMRLIDRLTKQVERVLTANQLTVVTKEVVETARKNLIIGLESCLKSVRFLRFLKIGKLESSMPSNFLHVGRRALISPEVSRRGPGDFRSTR